MGAFTTMTSKGQVTIPKGLRDQINLTTGTRIYMTVEDGKLIGSPKNRTMADLAGILGKPPRGAGASLEDLDKAVGKFVGDDDERIRREWHEIGGSE